MVGPDKCQRRGRLGRRNPHSDSEEQPKCAALPPQRGQSCLRLTRQGKRHLFSGEGEAQNGNSGLIPSWLISDRSADAATILMRDLSGRLRYRVQLTTDGHKAYLSAVEEAFGADIDYSQLIKIYGNPLEADTRYSPGECTGCKRERVIGRPDPLHVSTSYVERQNLTMRMSMRRFTRLTNAFSKKIENHAAAVAVFYMYYSFARIHQTLRVTPAMAAGVTDHVWGLEEIIRLIPDRKSGKRGPYRKRNSN